MNNAQISTTYSADNSHVDIILTGDLTLANSNELSKSMYAAIENVKSISVDAQDIANIDISCIQILYALRQQATSDKKELKITISVTESNQELLENAGITITNL